MKTKNVWINHKTSDIMKRVNHIISLFFILLLFLTGCEDTGYPDIILITGTEESNTLNFSIEGPASMGITVTASDVVPADTRVDLGVDPALIAGLNEQTGKNYVILPDGSYNLSAGNVVIHAGTHVSDQVSLNITSTDDFEEGVNYCVPVTINGTNGSMPVLESSRTVFILVRKTIITRAADLKKRNYFTVPSFVDNPDVAALPALTMECRVYVNSFHSSNPYISSIIGIEERFLLRFGDVSIARDEIMLAGGEVAGAGKYQLAATEKFSTGKWYHVAAVYTGSSMALYIDGRMVTQTEAAQGVVDMSWDYAGGFHIGYSADGRKLDGYVSEARLWSKALTASQLQESLCYVDPTSQGLIAYWRFNGAEGRNVTDLTGHGHTAVAWEDIAWVEGVRCP